MDKSPLATFKASPEPRGPAGEYLCVEGFLKTAVGARAIASALELGVIDYLLTRTDAKCGSLSADLRIDRNGLGLLGDLLCACGVCEKAGERLDAKHRPE